ncbi:MAG: CocE/NonD family hydrolase, partial [Rhodocyclaceae bacterium]|nr:CocE/NonD family hydrolase [Rhodocyclaceae bacterium]
LFAMGFIMSWHTTNMAHQLLGKPRSYNPDAFNNNMLWHYMRNDLDSGFWRMNSARWELIEVPVYSVGNWSGYSMHLRGNTEAWLCAASRHKKLRIHSGTHFHPFHSEEGRMDQLRFMDYWLKDIDTGIMDEPPVKLQIRTGGAAEPYAFRFEDEWPIARTQWTRFHLDIDEAGGEVDGILNPTPPAQERSVTYGASGSTKAGVSSSSTALMLASKDKLGTSFWTPPMQEDTEVTGPIVLNLWISSTSEDADIVVTLRNIGPDGEDVWEVGQQGQAVPLTKGCLRASHRKLDPKKSLPYRPYHAHDERQWLEPGVPVECQVEVWATCMVFRKGHRIRVDIQPRDGIGSNFYGHYHADYNLGAENTIYSGGDRQSYLLLPLIPPKA